MQRDRIGNSLRSAKFLGSKTSGILSDTVGQGDRNDIYRLKLNNSSDSNFTLNPTVKNGSVGVELFSLKNNNALRKIGKFDFSKLKSKDIRNNLTTVGRSSFNSRSRSGSTFQLAPGEYYLRVFQQQKNASYRLRYEASPAVVPPPTLVPPPTASPAPVPGVPVVSEDPFGGSPSPSPSPGTPTPGPTPSPTPTPSRYEKKWINQFGTAENDYAYGVATKNAKVIATGSTEGSLGGTNAGKITTNAPEANATNDRYVAQFDSAGSNQIIRQAGAAGPDVGSGIAIDEEGSYYVGGVKTEVFNAFPPLVVTPNPNGQVSKFRNDGQGSDGSLIWDQKFSTTVPTNSLTGPKDAEALDVVSSIALFGTGDDAVLYAGGLQRGVPKTNIAGVNLDSPSQAFITKMRRKGDVSASGDKVLWTKSLDGLSGTSAVTSITTDANGDIYVTGITNATLKGDLNNPYEGGDTFVAKYDASGGKLWQNILGSSATVQDFGRGIAVDATGIYVVGQTEEMIGEATGTIGGKDAFIAKYDEKGNRLWVKQFGTDKLDEAQGVATNGAGSIFVVGEVTLTGKGSDAFLTEFGSDGVRRSDGTILIGTTQNDEAYGITVDGSTIYIAGQTEGSLGGQNQGKYDAWVARYDIKS